MATHCRAMVGFQKAGSIVFDYGNNLRGQAKEAGWEGLFTPVMDFEVGYCEYNCTLCGQVCPSEAIRRVITSYSIHYTKLYELASTSAAAGEDDLAGTGADGRRHLLASSYNFV